MKQAYIYALCDPDTREIRYVGKTSHPLIRLKEHLRDKHKENTRKQRWVNKLILEGKQPELRILEVVNPSAWEAAEQKWIAFFRSKGIDLTNHTDGGEGLHEPSEETRKKMSQIRHEMMNDPEYRERLMVAIQNPDRRKKISLALTGKPKSPEHVAKLPQNRPGRKLSEETKAKMSANASGHRFSPEEISRLREANQGNQYGLGNKSRTGQKQSPEERMKKSVALKGREKTPEHVEKIREGLLRAWERRKAEGEFDKDGFAREMSERNRGENSAAAKLTEQDVQDIRRRYAVGNVTMQELSNEYGVTTSCISNIVTGKTWKHLLE